MGVEEHDIGYYYKWTLIIIFWVLLAVSWFTVIFLGTIYRIFKIKDPAQEYYEKISCKEEETEG